MSNNGEAERGDGWRGGAARRGGKVGWRGGAARRGGEVGRGEVYHPEDLKVLSFNLLADGKQGEEKWDGTPPDALVWQSRRWRLLEEPMITIVVSMVFIEGGH